MPLRFPSPEGDLSEAQLSDLMFINSNIGDRNYLVFANDFKGKPTKMTKENSKYYLKKIVKSGIPLTPQFALKVVNFEGIEQTIRNEAIARKVVEEYQGNNNDIVQRLKEIAVKYNGYDKTDKAFEESYNNSSDKLTILRSKKRTPIRAVSEDQSEKSPDTFFTPQANLPQPPLIKEEEEEKPKTFIGKVTEFFTPSPKKKKSKPQEDLSYLNDITDSDKGDIAISTLHLQANIISSIKPNSDAERIEQTRQINEINKRIKRVTEKRDLLYEQEDQKIQEEMERSAKILINEAVNDTTIKALGIVRDKSLTRDQTFEKLADLNVDVSLVDDFENIMEQFKPDGYVPPQPAPSPNPVEIVDPNASNPITSENVSPQFATSVKQVSKVEYHKDAIFWMYGNDVTPDWDTEFEKSILDREFSEEFMAQSSKDIISVYGPKIHVLALKADGNKQEFLELSQLQMSYKRGMQKGSRSKSALVAIKDITGFSNVLTGTTTTTTTTDGTDNSQITPLDQVETVLQQTPNAPPVGLQQTSFTQIPMNKAYENLNAAIDKSLKKYTINGLPLNITKFRPIQPSFKPSFDTRDYLNIDSVKGSNKFRFIN